MLAYIMQGQETGHGVQYSRSQPMYPTNGTAVAMIALLFSHLGTHVLEESRERRRRKAGGSTWLAAVENAVVHHLLRVLHVIDTALIAGLVDAKDRSSGDAGIDVGRTIQWVKYHHIVACRGSVEILPEMESSSWQLD